MSVGLFGAYTGSPRIQRAYATSGCTQTALASDDTSLRNALTNSSVTCIEIQGTIILTADLPEVDDQLWAGSPRASEGLTIFGTGDDTIAGSNQFQGPQIVLDDTNSAPVTLHVSELSLTGFRGYEGAAFRAYLKYQTGPLNADISQVVIASSETQQSGGAINVRSMHGDVTLTVTDSEFRDNDARWGGALYVFGKTDSTTIVDHSGFTNNRASMDLDGDGGAIFANSDSGVVVTVGPGTEFLSNEARQRGGAIFSGWYSGTPGYLTIAEDTVFAGNASGSRPDCTQGLFCYPGTGGAIHTTGSVTIEGSPVTPVLFSNNAAAGSGGAIHASGQVVVGHGATFDNNVATETATSITSDPGDGGAIFTASTVTVMGTASHPVAFTDDSATAFGGAVFAGGGGSLTSVVFERNTADWGGAAYSASSGWTIHDSTIRNNHALNAAGGVYVGAGHSAIYGSAIVGNQAIYSAGGVGTAGSVTFENSFIGSNSLSGGNLSTGGAGIRALGDVQLRFSTVYDNTSSGGASEIMANNIASVMSVVGNSTTANIWEFAGSLDDSYSVSTSDDTAFRGIGSGNVLPGELDLLPLTVAAPGTLGMSPDVTSPLALLQGAGTFAPAANPVPAVTRDQLGILRAAPFTIGARQAAVAAVPSVGSVSPSMGTTAGGDAITISGSGFTGATGASIGGSAVANFVVVNDSTITGTTPTGSAGAAAVSVTGPGGTGSLPSGFTFVAPNPPAPNPPVPAVPASAPRDVRVAAGVESVEASWVAPASSGSFPVTSYQAVAAPGGQACMVAAPALTCTITGLTAGTPYTVTARALTGAGWGATSSPSETVVPLSRPTPAPTATILITNSRDRAQKSIARVEGTTTGLVGAEVVPYVRIAGQKAFASRASTRTVDADGNFVWQRKANKRFTVYFVSGDVTSNRLVIRPE